VRDGMVPDPEQPGGFRLQRQGSPAGSVAPATSPSIPDRYRCSNCDQPIVTELVLRIDAERAPRREDDRPSRATGYLLISHLCACSPLALTSRRYRSYPAFVAMFGRGVSLPYESPFRPTLVPVDDPMLVGWRWELEQIDDVDELLYWLEHRRSG
jgi:hypothetical protein